MIEEIRIKDEDTFIDLGSGVGQVVLQVAACTNAKMCYGIEKVRFIYLNDSLDKFNSRHSVNSVSYLNFTKAEVPVKYSADMSEAFKFWMNWYGKKHSKYELMKGDFFLPKYHDTINEGTFIFVNNFAFGPEVDHNLKLRFQELKGMLYLISIEFS